MVESLQVPLWNAKGPGGRSGEVFATSITSARPTTAPSFSPALIEKDLERVRTAVDEIAPRFLLIGRRHIRSNNSWMHNIQSLAKGKDRCTLLINPLDAEALGLETNDLAGLRSKTGAIRVPVVISDEIMPSVVSLPHGFGHDVQGVRMGIASTVQAGANANALTDDSLIDEISGTAVFNGVPVEVSAVS